MHDPDAVGGQDFLHWTVWNIPPDTTAFAESQIPVGSKQGTNDFPAANYGPACPPKGTGLHHYIFELHALDTKLDLPEGANRQSLETAMQGHTIATARLVGLVQS